MEMYGTFWIWRNIILASSHYGGIYKVEIILVILPDIKQEKHSLI